jgi:hypothetical protein
MYITFVFSMITEISHNEENDFSVIHINEQSDVMT